ncbi:Fpg/Nei family DNA glycosylase [soil metagenome]
MPEGDTLHRTAAVLRALLLGKPVVAARGRPDGAQLQRVVGSRIDRVEAVGKHLLIGFDAGLTLHTHLRMHGSWHRYRPGERWRRSPSRAVAVIEVPSAVAVCFDAPTVELLATRALALHRTLRALGPDLLADVPDVGGTVRRLRDPGRSSLPIGEALLDQTVAAGIGNVYRSEVLWLVSVSPFAPVGGLDDGTLRRLMETGALLMQANRDRAERVTTPDALGGPPGADGPRRGIRTLNVHGHAGRPCPRCGSIIRARMVGGSLPRRVYWCPSCQAPAPADG